MIKVSAPGNIVLFGEHAVLKGEPAVGCAVDKRIVVTLVSRHDDIIFIESALGNYQATITTLPSDTKHRFVIAILRHWKSRFNYGFTIKITSDFVHTVGLGSSAALTVALTVALHQYFDHSFDRFRVLKEAIKIITDVQGCGSGLDAATSVYGGIIHYTSSPITVLPLTGNLPLSLYYCGYKKPTTEVISLVAEKARRAPVLYKQLYRLMGSCTREAIAAIKKNDLPQLGLCMSVYHGLMEALGVCDKTQAEMTHTLNSHKDLFGVKISGSGLGDCLVTLGKTPSNLFKSHQIPIRVTSAGVRLEHKA